MPGRLALTAPGRGVSPPAAGGRGAPCRAGVFRRCGGELLSGCPERSQRGTGGATGRTSALRPRSPCCLPPGPPFYGGRQLGSFCGFRKGAGGVGIDVAPPTAAAAWVGFPAWWFRRLRARLCVRWGTSFSVVNGMVTSTTLERRLRPRRRGRGIPTSSNVHRIRARWPGGDWDYPLKFPRAGTSPPGIRRIPP